MHDIKNVYLHFMTFLTWALALILMFPSILYSCPGEREESGCQRAFYPGTCMEGRGIKLNSDLLSIPFIQAFYPEVCMDSFN